MSEIMERHQEIVADFLEMDDWQERYEHIVDLGKELPSFTAEERRPELKVSGCVSQVWLRARLESGQLIFEADSDSIFVKGLIALLIRAYSGFTPEEVLSTEPDFIKEIGISENLSPNRANGLGSMVQRIKQYARSFAQ